MEFLIWLCWVWVVIAGALTLAVVAARPFRKNRRLKAELREALRISRRLKAELREALRISFTITRDADRPSEARIYRDGDLIFLGRDFSANLLRDRACPACHGTGHRPPTTDPDTGRGVADDCGHCAGAGVLP